MCDERGGVSDPEFPFALPELGALIAASPRIVASGPTRADASRANTPTGASYHDGIERYRSSIDQGVWPPVDFNGEFDALGVDVRALAPASAEDETPFPEVPDWLAAEDRDVFEAFRGEPPFAEQRHGPFADLCDFGTENTNDRRIASSPRSHARSPRRIRVPSSSVTREEKHLSAAAPTRVRPPEEDALFADDEIDDVSDDEAADDESAMRRAMRRSPRYPALLDAYFRCATVGASATRVAAAERRKRKLLERAARARDDGAFEQFRPTGHTFGHASQPVLGNTEPVPGSGSGSGSSSSSHSSKCSRWRDRRGEAGERGPGAEAASPQTPAGVFFGTSKNGPRAARADAGSVDAFMAECVSEMEAYAEDLRATYREAEDACAAFEARVATLGRLTLKSDDEDDAVTRNGVANLNNEGGCLSAPLPSTNDATTTNATDDGRTRLGATPKRGALPTPPPSASETLRETLKRKYAASILTLKDEFLKKRKKGKLPAAATEALKRWWRARVAWPYPSEEEKRALGAETRLDPTQINNWFINQRKRHWHKLFEGGVPPAAEAEARAALVERFGSIQAAIDGALGDA